MKRLLLAAGLLLFSLFPAQAQNVTAKVIPTCGTETIPLTPGNSWIRINQQGQLCVNASVSASTSPFTPGASGARGTPLTVTTSDSSGTLPTNGGAVVVTNVGANPMYCNVNAAAATTSDQYISAGGGWFNFGIPGGITTLRCIATGGSTTANMLGGSGLATGTGGGSGGGGGGGAITAASGSYASGAFSSGSFASGSMAAGSHAAGAGVDGWDLTQGAIGDASVTAGATGSISAKLRRISADIDSIKTAATTPLDNSSVKIDTASAATAQLVAISASTLVRVTAWDVIAGGAGTIKFVYGTGTNCGTGTTDLTGAYPLTAQAGIARGDGLGTLFKTPAGNALCITTTGGVQMSGVVTYQQF